MRSFKTACWVFLVCLALVACRRNRSAPSAATLPASESAAALGVAASALPDHKALYDAITKYMTANQGRAAKDVEELVQKGFLKPLPPLPPGKRYELDQRAAVLAIVDR